MIKRLTIVCCIFLIIKKELNLFIVYRNVTPQTTLEFRVWSHHTLKADALLGKATVDLKQALEIHNRRCKLRIYLDFVI